MRIAILLAAATLAFAKGRDVVLPAESLTWDNDPHFGIDSANLWGDAEKGGPWGAMIRYKAGVVEPLHKHKRDIRLVVVSGTLLYNDAKLGPGSYVLIAAGSPHTRGCSPDAECRILLSSSGKYDIEFVKP